MSPHYTERDLCWPMAELQRHNVNLLEMKMIKKKDTAYYYFLRISNEIIFYNKKDQIHGNIGPFKHGKCLKVSHCV